MSQTGARTGFEKWQDGINSGTKNSKWDEYDCEIQRAVSDVNHHLVGTPAFRPLNWKLIKAMAWVETGADHEEWRTRPLQIGVQGDPGLTSLLSPNEGGPLVLPPAWGKQLTMGTVRTIPAHNIRAGIAYLLMRLAIFDHKSIATPGTSIAFATVRPGDNLSKLARDHHTTPEILQSLNTGTATLRPGQVLKYRRGAVGRVITGWRPISPTNIAKRYNGGGDPNYSRKLDYALEVMGNRTERPCI